jgi:hypothetical protein
MRSLDNVTTTNDYGDATLGPVVNAQQLTVVVANQSAFMQIASGRYGEDAWGPELLVTPSLFTLTRASGVRFKTAIAGKPAQILAVAWEPADPQPAGSAPFTSTLASSGSVTPGQAAVQVSKDGVVIGTEPELDFLTGAGLALTVTDDPANERVRVTYAISAPICRLTHSVAQSIANATQTVLTWDTEREDNDGMHTAGAPTLITFVTAGLYAIGTIGRWASNATGYRFLEMELLPSGGGVVSLGADSRPAVNGSITMQSAHDFYRFAVGDAIRVQATQTSGGPLDVQKDNARSPEFWAVRVAP